MRELEPLAFEAADCDAAAGSGVLPAEVEHAVAREVDCDRFDPDIQPGGFGHEFRVASGTGFQRPMTDTHMAREAGTGTTRRALDGV
ncbi:MAG: hypothetical protein OEM32_09420 [Acidimicrobiia bacterium]|nr:hypothetical protein [Acidimicrobiia bacterium]